MSKDFLTYYQGKNVLITGNTGFKGSWLTVALKLLGADVKGYSLEPPTVPAIYDQIGLSKDVEQYISDVRSLIDLKKCLEVEQPDIIFHLAAQPLVRESYNTPVETFDTNVMGTVNLLEAIRVLNLSTTVILITSDKCYHNREWLFGYREEDALGGKDPYSASKGAAEIVIGAYRNSFFNPGDYAQHGVRVASARAGNVIGGGDWAADRIVPDCVKAVIANEDIKVRNPSATRPWQHVLEPIVGYLILGLKVATAPESELNLFCDAFNFGPNIQSNRSVKDLVQTFIGNWKSGSWSDQSDPNERKRESSLLNLTIEKAFHLLDWNPLWDFEKTLLETVDWYKTYAENESLLREKTINQVSDYLDEYQRKNPV
jgi:CDP-glucose 4,6-dehydratase